MARLLVQLKLRLLRNALRSSTRAKTSFILSTIFAALVAVGTFAGLAVLRGQSASVDLTAVVFTLLAFGWLILPLLAFGLDGTLDPATLALYPLRTRPLAVGLLAASATGAWPLANLLGLLGVTVGLARGGFGLLVALVAVLLEVLFCITLARFVTTGLAGLLRSRRGKDFAAFLIIPIFALYEVFTQLVPKLAAEGKLTPASFAGVDAWMRWIPPGLAAHAIQDASNGHPGTALLRLALLAAVIVVLGWLWIRSLGRALVTVDTSTQSSAVRGAALPFARFGLRGTVAARFWIYQRREPSSIIYWCIIGVVMLAASVSTILTPSYHAAARQRGPRAALLAVLHADSIGMTGPGFGLEATALTGAAPCAPTSPATTSCSPSSRCRCSRRCPSASRPSPGIRWTDSGHGDRSRRRSARAWPWAASSPSTVPYPAEKRVGSPGAQARRRIRRPPARGRPRQPLRGAAASRCPRRGLTQLGPAAVRLPVLVLCAAGTASRWPGSGGRIAARAAEPRAAGLYQIAIRSKL